jgi:hypothetical protein
METSSHDRATATLRFVRRLSWCLQTIFAILAAISVWNVIAEWSGWFSLIGLLFIWAFFLASAHGLLRRQNWARLATIGVLGWIGVAVVWAGAVVLLAGLGISSTSGPDASPTYEIALRVGSVAVGMSLLAIAYLCWRLILRLRSPEVRQVFLFERGASA